MPSSKEGARRNIPKRSATASKPNASSVRPPGQFRPPKRTATREVGEWAVGSRRTKGTPANVNEEMRTSPCTVGDAPSPGHPHASATARFGNDMRSAGGMLCASTESAG